MGKMGEGREEEEEEKFHFRLADSVVSGTELMKCNSAERRGRYSDCILCARTFLLGGGETDAARCSLKFVFAREDDLGGYKRVIVRALHSSGLLITRFCGRAEDISR